MKLIEFFRPSQAMKHGSIPASGGLDQQIFGQLPLDEVSAVLKAHKADCPVCGDGGVKLPEAA